MKIIRWTLGIIVTLLALFVIAIVLLVNFINPNDYKDQISQVASKQIHQPMSIQGDISWVIFPELGFKVQDISIGTTNTNSLSAKLKTLDIRLKLWPLLHKQIELNAIQIDGLQLVLPADNSATHTTPAPTPEASATTAAAGSLSMLSSLSLQSLSIENTAVTQLTAARKTAWQVKNFSLESNNITSEHSFPLKTHFDFLAPDKKLDATIDLSSQITYNNEGTYFTLEDSALRLKDNQLNKPTLNLILNLEKATVDLAKDHAQLNGIEGDFNKLHFSGSALDAQNLTSNPSATGDIQLQTNDLKGLLDKLGGTLPTMQSKMAATAFSLKTQYHYGNNQFALEPFSLQLDNNRLDGKIQSTDLKNLALQLVLKSQSIDVGSYLPPASKPLTLSGLQLNLNLLPPGGADKNWLASSIAGTLQINKVKYDTQSFSNIAAQLDAKEQIFKLLSLKTDGWQGHVEANGVIDLRGSTPHVTLHPNVRNVQIDSLLQQFEPKFKLSGLANLSGDLDFSGGDASSIMRSLNGNLKVNVNNGVLHGIDAGYWVNVSSALLHRESLPVQRSGTAQTPFGNLSATLRITNGVLNNTDLLMAGPIAQVKGQGTIDLGRETLNYRVQVAKTNQTTGGAHKDTVPLIISGTFDNPSVQPDMNLIAKQVISNEVDKQKDKLVGQLTKNLGGNGSPIGQQLGNAIGQLLG